MAVLNLKNLKSPDARVMLATNSLERGLAVLRMIGQKRGGVTHAEISRRLEIPKSTCTYILKRLEGEGFAVRNRVTGRYRIGVDVLPLARHALLEVDIVSLAKPVLYELAKSIGLMVILGVRAGDRVVAIDCLDGSAFAFNTVENTWPEERRSGAASGLGSEYSLHSSAPGKVLLAYSRPKNFAETGGACAQPAALPLRQPSPATECAMAELEHIRERGYAIRERRFALDPFSIAAPVFDAKGNVRAALCLEENVLRPGSRDLAGWVMLLQKASQGISRRLQMQFTDRELSMDCTMRSLETGLSGDDEPNLANFSQAEQALPPRSLNHPANRPSYVVAHRGQGFIAS